MEQKCMDLVARSVAAEAYALAQATPPAPPAVYPTQFPILYIQRTLSEDQAQLTVHVTGEYIGRDGLKHAIDEQRVVSAVTQQEMSVVPDCGSWARADLHLPSDVPEVEWNYQPSLLTEAGKVTLYPITFGTDIPLLATISVELAAGQLKVLVRCVSNL